MLRQRTFFALAPFSFGRSVWQAAAVCITAAMLTACGKSSDDDGMRITTRTVDPPTTIAAAADLANDAPAVVVPNNSNERVRARIESADDQHHFKTPVSEPGMLTLTTTGEVDTEIRAFTLGGVEISGTPGSLIVTITVEIARDGAIVVRVTPAPAVSVTPGVYTLSANFAAQPGTTTPPT